MSKSQRVKGASYEREVCHVLTAHSGQIVQRNIGQSRDGGDDITWGGFRIECKRRKTLGTIEKWLSQAQKASKPEETPIVIARSDGGKSLVILELDAFLKLRQGEIK